MTDESKRLLKEHCSSFSPILLGLLEPKKAFHKVQHSFWTSLNLIPIHQNCRGHRCSNIWVLSHPSVVSNTVYSSDHVVVVDCFWQSMNFRVAFVHGANDQISRRSLWQDLLRFVSGNTVFIGDFNAVKGAHERISAVAPHRGSCVDFCSFIDDTQFIESPTDGLRFTWSGRRFLPHHVESMLDRAMFSQGFANFWDSITTTALPRLSSDHSPLVMQCRRATPSGKRQFRFLNMWVTHSSFGEMVGASWMRTVDALCPIVRVMLKLKRLREDLRIWNREVFGNVDIALRQWQQQLMATQKQIADTGYTDDLFNEEVHLQAELNVALSRKSSLLQQKSRASWLTDGDRNTAFFHRLTKFKQRNNSFTRMNINGTDVYDPGLIEQHIVSYFSELFMDDGGVLADQLEIDALIQPSISENQNTMLIRIPDDGEIAAAVFSLDANSAPGPDGFSGMFFHTCWSTIKDDIIMAVQRFFTHSYLPSGCNASTMILIPKKEVVSTVADLRPIILSNFLFKIISKVLASRLSVLANSHVAPNQFGFISGRNIHDCIMLSSEGFNCMQRTNRGINMACKIDIRNAFDTLRWGFIFQVLRANGYHENFIHWISIIFSSARLSILYNGRLTGYFACSRGVRQGDPLSPILFGIAEDVLSSLISSCVDSRHLTPMSFSRFSNFPTHLLYADDVILFCRATIRNAKKILDILQYYGSISGQLCSQEKSNLFFSRHVSTDRRRAIHRILGFSVGSLPMTYLGVPIFTGRPRASYFIQIFDKIVQKFAKWKGLQLSMAGRLCLVKSVIQSSIVHSMMVYKWPKSLLHSLDRYCRNFVWTGNINQRASCPVSWGRSCSPKLEGGLGIRSFTIMNQSFFMKLAWKMIKGEDWAHQIMRSRYLTTFSYAKDHIVNSSVWLGLKDEVNHLVDDSYACVDSGDCTYFWRDDWLGYKLVDKLKIPTYMHDFLNFSVQDYFYDNTWHFSTAFVNSFPEVVADIILVPMNGGKDARFWKHSVSGNVSTALAFARKGHRFPEVNWGKWIWEPFIPVRRSILCWRVIHGRLPTLDILIRQGMVRPNGCVICYACDESISHVLWSCSKVKPIWKEFLSWFDKDMLEDCLDIHSFLVQAWTTKFSSQLLSFWKAGVITMMWKIWDSRNSMIFDNETFDHRRILAFVKSFFKEMDLTTKNIGTINNTWPDYLITRAIGAPELIAAGGVFRDHHAAVRGCFHIKGGSGFAFEAELLDVITAINIAHDRNWCYLWIEADSIEGNLPADIMACNDRVEGWWPFAIDNIKIVVASDMFTHSHSLGALKTGVQMVGLRWQLGDKNLILSTLSSWDNMLWSLTRWSSLFAELFSDLLICRWMLAQMLFYAVLLIVFGYCWRTAGLITTFYRAHGGRPVWSGGKRTYCCVECDDDFSLAAVYTFAQFEGLSQSLWRCCCLVGRWGVWMAVEDVSVDGCDWLAAGLSFSSNIWRAFAVAGMKRAYCCAAREGVFFFAMIFMGVHQKICGHHGGSFSFVGNVVICGVKLATEYNRPSFYLVDWRFVSSGFGKFTATVYNRLCHNSSESTKGDCLVPEKRRLSDIEPERKRWSETIVYPSGFRKRVVEAIRCENHENKERGFSSL
ncbi:uncharacterized protein LOC130994018 [Salvia miltiorrhiza]|uniref:uncharacterized protein LOC130994018 n=1 Tax=Salvia miltiorrhiza TaxID=226208 RepID=UPI0025AD6DC9|nr:uncharacterized protein LOC130994018 [Salvia miltiorrhiza]